MLLSIRPKHASSLAPARTIGPSAATAIALLGPTPAAPGGVAPGRSHADHGAIGATSLYRVRL
jgi:hypothetical protein